VFGVIKSALGFRQFLLRGLDNVRSERSRVTMAWNIKRIFALRPRSKTAIASSRLKSSLRRKKPRRLEVGPTGRWTRR